MRSGRHLFPLICAMALGGTVIVHDETPEEREARKALPPDPDDLAYNKRQDVLRGVYGIAARDELIAKEKQEFLDRQVEYLTKKQEPSTDPRAVEIRQETLTRRQINFRKRLPRGHPDRID